MGTFLLIGFVAIVERFPFTEGLFFSATGRLAGDGLASYFQLALDLSRRRL